jgi:hypothetical protein
LRNEGLHNLYSSLYIIRQIKSSELGSSVSIVSGYGLDDRAKEVRSPADAKETGSGAHPASCTMGTKGPFPGAKARPGRDTDHSPHLEPRSRMSSSYTLSPPKRLLACGGTDLASVPQYHRAGVAQSVQCLTTDWATGRSRFDPR